MRLFLDALVYPLDPAAPTPTSAADIPAASALLVGDDGTVVATGEPDELRALATAPEAPATLEEISLGGRVVLPGPVDGHLHAMSHAESLAEVDLRATTSLEEAIEVLRDYAVDLPADRWITGGRWDYNKWGLDEQPDRAALDAAFPDRPVALSSIDFHTLWANGAALAAAGITDASPDPAGGQIVRDGTGRATGILREGPAMKPVFAAIPELPVEVRADLLARAQEQWVAEGLVGVHCIDGPDAREAWEVLHESGRLDLRIVKYLTTADLPYARGAEWHTGDGDAKLRRGGLKLFSDGALGSQSSHMSSPYPHSHARGADGVAEEIAEENYGIQIATEDQLVAGIREALELDIALAIHAIGDQANHHVLNAYERTHAESETARKRSGRPLRHRIEHAQFVQPDDVARFAAMGIVASMQPRHCISDLHLLDKLRPDPELAAYAWTDLEGVGAVVSFGSDGPVEPTNPFVAIYAAMTRADANGDPLTTYQPERRMSAYRAWVAHTRGPAHAAGWEDRAGALAPGMFADFVVLDVDPFVPGTLGAQVQGASAAEAYRVEGDGVTGEYPDEASLFAHARAIRDTRPVMTVIGGEIVYRAEG
ncbi:amidohydrolase [Brevibacterium litoralis]|uniref:amidohydrolase n=1 Tax=Brevibacterium litoralis TaxID=3138935 RepID=UPI0032EF8F75